jgi:hypothetical protein
MLKRILVGLALIGALAACSGTTATPSASAPSLDSPSAPSLESPSNLESAAPSSS